MPTNTTTQIACRASINLAPEFITDTWDGISEASLSSDGTAFANPLETITMTFKDADGTTGLTLSSEDANEITIEDANAWQFTVLPQNPLGLAAGTWSWRMQFTDSEGRAKTYLTGSLTII